MNTGPSMSPIWKSGLPLVRSINAVSRIDCLETWLPLIAPPAGASCANKHSGSNAGSRLNFEAGMARQPGIPQAK